MLSNATHKGPHTVWFQLCEMSRTGKFREKDSRLVVARVLGEGREWGATANGYGGSFGGDENVLKLDSGDACTTLSVMWNTSPENCYKIL